jgi:hypothetical protein
MARRPPYTERDVQMVEHLHAANHKTTLNRRIES